MFRPNIVVAAGLTIHSPEHLHERGEDVATFTGSATMSVRQKPYGYSHRQIHWRK